MKKIILGIATVLFSLLTCIPAYAADKPIKTLPNITDISVYAAYVDATRFSIIPTDKDGNGSMALTNGTIITVSGADSARGRIAVEEITDKEVLDWITEQFEDKTNGTKAYHVYLLDDNGVSKPVDDVKIMVKPKNGHADSVYSVGNDQTGKLQFTSENGEITFIANGAYFYALCNDSPQQTGSTFLIILIVAVGCAASFIVVFIKKRNHSKS